MVILLNITITSLPNVISPDAIRRDILVICSQTIKQILIYFPWLPKCIVLWAVIRKFNIEPQNPKTPAEDDNNKK